MCSLAQLWYSSLPGAWKLGVPNTRSWEVTVYVACRYFCWKRRGPHICCGAPQGECCLVLGVIPQNSVVINTQEAIGFQMMEADWAGQCLLLSGLSVYPVFEYWDICIYISTCQLRRRLLCGRGLVTWITHTSLFSSVFILIGNRNQSILIPAS